MNDIRNCPKCGGTHFGSNECPIDIDNKTAKAWAAERDNVVRIAATEKKPTEAEIAADLKARVAEAMKPVCALMDEANRYGMTVHWDSVGIQLPFGNKVVNLKILKYY